MTIVGENLRSDMFQVGDVTDNTSGQGENFKITLKHGKTETQIPCKIDRMMALHGQSLAGQDQLFCETQAVPFYDTWQIYFSIDDKPEIYAGSVGLTAANAPTAEYFFPSASAPAKADSEWDYDRIFYTPWYNIDTTTDNVEDESIHLHFRSDRNMFQKCYNPIDIEVWDLDADESYQASVAQNADGLTVPTYQNVLQGFKCENSIQSPGATGETPTCPNVKVRYRCHENVIEMHGRIYTQVHGRSDHKKLHVNRLHEYPKLRTDSDGFQAECSNHLNDGQDCGDHPNCGKNERLMLKLTNGNNGIIQFLPRVEIPGGYNFTFTTLHNGHSVSDKRLQNFLTNPLQYPVNFEVYPRIDSVTPQTGSIYGGTLVTVSGSGFVSDGLGGTVEISIGANSCEIVQLTETQIICKSSAEPEPKSSHRIRRDPETSNIREPYSIEPYWITPSSDTTVETYLGNRGAHVTYIESFTAMVS